MLLAAICTLVHLNQYFSREKTDFLIRTEIFMSIASKSRFSIIPSKSLKDFVLLISITFAQNVVFKNESFGVFFSLNLKIFNGQILTEIHHCVPYSSQIQLLEKPLGPI